MVTGLLKDARFQPAPVSNYSRCADATCRRAECEAEQRRWHAENPRLAREGLVTRAVLCDKPSPAPPCIAPLLFDGIVGKDSREERSPSWFNADECMRVLEHIKDLMRPHNGCRKLLKAEDIGVIAPYNKQVQKLKRLLKSHDLGDVKVGSTEMFQGQERTVIIISTVRSSAHSR